ncbi:MAG: HDOD domain-containing protein [Chitinispirillaceae bacterium]|nr:HDOD domain-containing protein [Chitinispirillaceae bacterium]
MEHLPFIKNITTLPTPSPVLRRISAVVANPASSMEQVVEAVRFDPAIAGKILRLANSAYIGMPRTVASLQNALVLIGLKRVQTLVLVSQFSGLPSDRAGASLSLERFWRHSTMAALIAESIGRHLKRYVAVDEQELFSAAILHDIGKLVLAAYDGETIRLAGERAAAEGKPFFAAEEENRSHTVVGALLADQWGFPPLLSAAIARHHSPDAAGPGAPFVSFIHVADVMSHLIGAATHENEIAPPLDPSALLAVRLPPERLRIIAETEAENQARIEELSDVFVR